MLIQKITYIVHGEKESETLSKIESSQKWLERKAVEVADTISHLRGRAKTKFEEDPDEYILNYFSDEDFEKCIYAAMSNKKPFSVEEERVVSHIILKVSQFSDYKESDRPTPKTEFSLKIGSVTEQVLAEVREYKQEIHKKH